jgi:hypothetical protein
LRATRDPVAALQRVYIGEGTLAWDPDLDAALAANAARLHAALMTGAFATCPLAAKLASRASVHLGHREHAAAVAQALTGEQDLSGVWGQAWQLFTPAMHVSLAGVLDPDLGDPVAALGDPDGLDLSQTDATVAARHGALP